MRKGLIITVLGFVALATIAVAGWVRTPSSSWAAAPLTHNCFDQALAPTSTAYAAPAVEPLTPAAVAAARQPTRRVVTVREANYQPTRVVRKRSTKKSVAIVAGSAGAGAAIGALAGGGKGAAIGALSGGTAGFIYDRLTRKKRE